jgi:hypothetical protein
MTRGELVCEVQHFGELYAAFVPGAAWGERNRSIEPGRGEQPIERVDTRGDAPRLVRGQRCRGRSRTSGDLASRETASKPGLHDES